MTLEHRLQHAARELREIRVDVPPLGGAPTVRRRGRLHALATPLLLPLLFVTGALFAVGAAHDDMRPATHGEIPAADAPAVRSAVVQQTEPPGAAVVSAPSVLVEMELIAELRRRSEEQAAEPAPTSDRTGRRVGIIGPV